MPCLEGFHCIIIKIFRPWTLENHKLVLRTVTLENTWSNVIPELSPHFHPFVHPTCSSVDLQADKRTEMDENKQKTTQYKTLWH